MDDVILTALVGLGSFVVGGGAVQLISLIKNRKGEELPDVYVDTVEPPHEHRYDTMRADGKGWCCGICNEPKESVIA